MDVLQGNVKCVTKYGSGIIQNETWYSADGKVSEIKLYKKGALVSIQKMYEKDGWNIREIRRLGDHAPQMIIYHYSDSYGNRNRTEFYDADHRLLEEKEIGKTSMEYNDKGKLISFSKNGIILFQKQFNRDNRAIEELSFSDSGDLIYTVKYIHHGNVTVRKSFDAEKRLVKLRHWVTDEKNRVLQSFKFSRYRIENDYDDYHQTFDLESCSRIKEEHLKSITSENLPGIEDFPLDENFVYISEIKSLLNEFRYDENGNLLPGHPPIDFFNELTETKYDHADREISNEKYGYQRDFSENQLTLLEYSTHEYDDKNLLISHSHGKTERDHDFGGSYIYTYEFDSENRIIKKITTGDRESITRISYEDENRTEVEEFENNDQKWTHIYDRYNNLIYYEDASDSKSWKWSESYDIIYY